MYKSSTSARTPKQTRKAFQREKKEKEKEKCNIDMETCMKHKAEFATLLDR